VSCNDNLARDFKIKSEEIAGKTDYDFFSKKLAEKYRADDKRIIETEQTEDIEESYIQEGREVIVHTVKTPVKDAQGNVIGILGIFWDITERKRAEEAYRAIVDHSLQGFEILQDERVVFANQAMAEITGYTVEEMLAMSSQQVQAFVHPEDQALVWGRHRDRLKGKELPERYEFRGIRKDGTMCWLEIHARRIEYQGKPAVQVAYLDITERKRAEDELQKARDELEIRVEQRTADLAKANVQLRSLASELSLAEERLRRRFAMDVHDHVGQNLAISKIKIESLRESVSSPELAKGLEEIRDLISQTIESTRSLTFELSPPVLYELGFEAAVEWLVRQTRQQHGLSTEFKGEGQTKPLDNDVRILLFQAVRELLVNVVKYAQAHNVTVSTRRVGNEIRVSVEDDGVGFDVSQTGSYDYKTGGFGLFSIRERLGHMGGRLEIESKPGVGTRVTLTAPIDQESQNSREGRK
jgi:PAS domain S-box-containing protein